jgi:hypothetical protein
MPRVRKPANDAEVEALKRWQGGYPITAMRTLADAGYDRDARARFLVEVARCTEDVNDFAADSYVSLFTKGTS